MLLNEQLRSGHLGSQHHFQLDFYHALMLTDLLLVSQFITGGLALNTARDLGARFACGAIYGSECFPAKYTALAALTNILSTFIAVFIYTFILADSRRPPAHVALSHLASEEEKAVLHATRTHEELMEKRGTDGGSGLMRRITTGRSTR